MNRIATRLAVTATALALSAVALQAATVRIETSSHAMSGMDAARAAWSNATGPDAVVEDFEGFAAWNGVTGTPASLVTRVGTIRGESSSARFGRVGRGRRDQSRDPRDVGSRRAWS